MTLRNGFAATDLGGAVRAANVTVDHSTFSGNVSAGGGGAIGVTNSASGVGQHVRRRLGPGRWGHLRP